ncbi:hypothetical protein IscW_ISCW000127 [Ixodes scapularis]|uniref:Uncharacterized protein n=1 Tax=Ixodes scapularis TaxID=6945 RepID=B7P0U2_IXOSC|nr:hypothetical protein IscW_ISCW000127 [Ixodes scapularis]|eukprot:XP_002399368.1 hypothetical protein IscW_ISCW000127 [Ixodes scapularis]
MAHKEIVVEREQALEKVPHCIFAGRSPRNLTALCNEKEGIAESATVVSPTALSTRCSESSA